MNIRIHVIRFLCPCITEKIPLKFSVKKHSLLIVLDFNLCIYDVTTSHRCKQRIITSVNFTVFYGFISAILTYNAEPLINYS